MHEHLVTASLSHLSHPFKHPPQSTSSHPPSTLDVPPHPPYESRNSVARADLSSPKLPAHSTTLSVRQNPHNYASGPIPCFSSMSRSRLPEWCRRNIKCLKVRCSVFVMRRVKWCGAEAWKGSISYFVVNTQRSGSDVL